MTHVRLLSDDPADHELVARFLRDGPDDPPSHPDPTSFLADAHAFGVAAFTEAGDGDGDPVAIVALAYGHELLHPDGDRTALLYSLDVREQHRRQGHGRALVVAFVDEARRRGCSEVWVLTDDTNLAALATYASTSGTREPTPQVMFSWTLVD